MKTCSKCITLKDNTFFYTRKTGNRTGELYGTCIKCMRTRGIKYYRDNQKRQSALGNMRRERKRQKAKTIIDEIKKAPCMDCGVSYPPYVMDFDHRDETVKVDNVANMVGHANNSMTLIMEEIAKCDLVCANCHRIRTHNRDHS